MVSRMQFLRGDFSGRSAPSRPPWALSEGAFIARCDRCGDCIAGCPTAILHAGRGGFPEVDFGRGECLFCGDCVAVCRPRALDRSGPARPWSLCATIDPQACLAGRNIECRCCADPCGPRAIRMRPAVGRVAQPVVDERLCTGCGACFAVCPARAIAIAPAAGPQEAL